jgi:hypothetical protein
MASIATTRGAALSAAGADAATALTGGSQLALTFAAMLIVAAIGVTWTVLRMDRPVAVNVEATERIDVERMPDAA